MPPWALLLPVGRENTIMQLSHHYAGWAHAKSAINLLSVSLRQITLMSPYRETERMIRDCRWSQTYSRRHISVTWSEDDIAVRFVSTVWPFSWATFLLTALLISWWLTFFFLFAVVILNSATIDIVTKQLWRSRPPKERERVSQAWDGGSLIQIVSCKSSRRDEKERC